ncbi:MAG: hypothetical protein HQL32_09915 [Planctomycetes bacterium]|nr:hypothetical protein [Planctomycetota bacterium]
MKNKYYTLILIPLIALFAIACGGGGNDGVVEDKSSSTTVRFAGGKSGDTLKAYTLAGKLVEEAAMSSSGSFDMNLSKGSYHIKLGIGGVEIFETLILSSDFDNVENNVLNLGYINGATTWAAGEALKSGSAESAVSSALYSATGSHSLSGLSLGSVATGFSSDALAEIKATVLATGMAVKAADAKTLSQSNWDGVSTALDSLFDATAANAYDKAQALSTALREIDLDDILESSDMSSPMANLFGTSDSAQKYLRDFQSADSSGGLAVLADKGLFTAATLYSKGVAALEAEETVKAYEFFEAAAFADGNNENARVMAAIYRMITSGVRSNRETKTFLKASNVSFDFTNLGAIRDADKNDNEDKIVDVTAYNKVAELTGIPGSKELYAYLEDVYLRDIEDSINDLAAVSMDSFPKLSITPKMQGKLDEDEEGNAIVPTSAIELDGYDLRAFQASLKMSQAEMQYLLAMDLDIEGKTTTPAAMKQFMFDLSGPNDPLFKDSAVYTVTGKVEFVDSYNYSYEDDSSGVTEPAVLGAENASVTLDDFQWAASYPGELNDLVHYEDGEDDWYESVEVFLVENMDQYNFHYWYNVDFSEYLDGDYEYCFRQWYRIMRDGQYVNVEVAIFSAKSLSSLKGYVREHFYKTEAAAEVYSNGPDYIGYALYDVSGTLKSGSLSLDSTHNPVYDDDDVAIAALIEANPSFATANKTLLKTSRTNLRAGAEIASELLDDLQTLGITDDRGLHLIEDISGVEHSESSLEFSNSEINNLQGFISQIFDSFEGPATVDPSFIDSSYASATIDSSALFETDPRNFMVDSSGKVITVIADDGDENMEGDDAEAEEELDNMVIDSGKLFGVAPKTGEKLEDVFDAFGDSLGQWLDYGEPVFTGSTAPTVLTNDYLSGNTLYNVWYGSGEAEDGSVLENVSVVMQVQFGDYDALWTGLRNSYGTEESNYYIYGSQFYDSGYGSGHHVIYESGVSEDYFLTEYYDQFGTFDNIDAWFFDKAKALAFAETLTATITGTMMTKPEVKSE